MYLVRKDNPMIKVHTSSIGKTAKLYEGDSPPWTNDAYMAGYLGFSDRSEYLKFLLSPPILDLYRWARPYLLSKGWLEVLHYKYRDRDPENFEEYEEILSLHPIDVENLPRPQKIANQDFGLAKLVCKGYALIQRFYSLPGTERQ